MSKMTVAEAAEHFKVSKEAIHNRIRRGTLDSTIENGVKFVTVEKTPGRSGGGESRFYAYIEEENKRLKERTVQLESQVEKLRDQREAMLIDERKKIEQIYKERDEQLKSILEVFASKLLPPGTAEHLVEESVTAEIVSERDVAETPEAEASAPEPEKAVPLKTFLKLKGYGKKKRERVKQRIKDVAEEDDRITSIEGKPYLRPSEYDYSDLLE